MTKPKRKIPDELAEKQARQRKETVIKIQQAIDELQSEGAIITTSKLVERTKLSRSTINKPHAQEVLQKNQVGRYQQRKVFDSDNSLEGRLLALEKELKTIKAKHEDERKKRSALQSEHDQLKEKYQIMFGKYHRAIVMARNYGAPIDNNIDGNL